MEDCKKLDELIKYRTPYIKTSIAKVTGGCVLDYEDEELRNKVNEISGLEFAGIFSSRGSVAITDKIDTDLPVNMLSKERKFYSGHVEMIEETDECKINEVHIHNEIGPSVHIRMKCDIAQKERALKTISKLIDKTNNNGRKIVGLKFKHL